MKTLLPFLIFLLSACSAQWHIRQAVSKDPSIFLNNKAIILRDTVYTNSIRVDTLAHFISDTITIEKERLRIQIKRIHDTLRVVGECRADTIEVIREVQLPPTIEYKPSPKWKDSVLFILGIFAFAAVARKVLDRVLR